jgi:NhaP-type Na+/H+ or K+/H+ antiporter
MTDTVQGFAIAALVLTVAALVSRIVEKWYLSLPLFFLALGFLLGEPVLGVLDIHPEDRIVEIVATLALVLVLFLDAVKLNVDELNKGRLIPFLVLGPGTALVLVLGGIAVGLLFEFGWTMAFIAGAILASTDPVVLRDIVRDPRIPRSIRHVLKIEAGMNDIVVLPVILVLIAVARHDAGSPSEWSIFISKLLLIGPAIGFAIGGAGSWLISRIDKQTPIRREYQALFGIGLVFGAYAAATAAGGDGFLAAFAAGLGVVVLNQRLCDCFLDYGEVTSEMAMLFAFVLFGAVLAGVIGEVDVAAAVLLAALVIAIIRPMVLAGVLVRAKMSWPARAFIGWFGPRGLNSLLLALLVVHAALPNAVLLLATIGIVVLASLVVHGATALPFASLYQRKVAKETLEEERETTAAGLFVKEAEAVPRVRPAELKQMMESAAPPIVLDVRSRSSFEADSGRILGSQRIEPDAVAEWASRHMGDKRRPIVAYCT